MWIGGAVSGSAQAMRRKDWAIDAVAQTEVYPLKIHVMPYPYGTCITDLPQNKIPAQLPTKASVPENRVRGQMIKNLDY
jgi:hypothetical protein